MAMSSAVQLMTMPQTLRSDVDDDKLPTAAVDVRVDHVDDVAELFNLSVLSDDDLLPVQLPHQVCRAAIFYGVVQKSKLLYCCTVTGISKARQG